MLQSLGFRKLWIYKDSVHNKYANRANFSLSFNKLNQGKFPILSLIIRNLISDYVSYSIALILYV